MAPQVEVLRTPAAPAETDILREQLEYLIDHATGSPQCGCSECQRYLRVRSILLEIFGEPPGANFHEIGQRFRKAA